MRVPIAYALHHPDRVDVPVRTLDLAAVGALTFEPPDLDAFPCLRLAREAARPAAPRPACSTPPTRSPCTRSSSGRLDFMGIPAVIETTLEQLPAAAGALVRDALRRRRRGAPRRRREDRGARMSWVLAFLGFAALIILHEAGHFAAAKAVGMRVERFALFFPPLLAACVAARPSTRSVRSRSAAT